MAHGIKSSRTIATYTPIQHAHTHLQPLLPPKQTSPAVSHLPIPHLLPVPATTSPRRGRFARRARRRICKRPTLEALFRRRKKKRRMHHTHLNRPRININRTRQLHPKRIIPMRTSPHLIPRESIPFIHNRDRDLDAESLFYAYDTLAALARYRASPAGP
jgi:hypothetical protein